MRSSKLQAPSSRKTPSAKIQTLAGGSLSWREEETNGEMVLHDGLGSGERHPFDLEERTARFGEAIIRFAKKIPRGPGNDRLISQLVGCGTSLGANYHEANECVSKKDFRCSVTRCLKESKETKFFLRMVAASEPQLAEEARVLYRETTELLRIFSSMRNK